MQEMGMEFKHLGVMAWPETSRNLVFKFAQIQNLLEKHETWHGVKTWRQHVVVIFCPIGEGAHINNQQSYFGTSVITLQSKTPVLLKPWAFY